MKYTNSLGQTVSVGTLFLNGLEYHGEVVFVNGYNGYTSDKFDGVLCAIVDNSVLNEFGEINLLGDEFNEMIISKYNRGQHFNV